MAELVHQLSGIPLVRLPFSLFICICGLSVTLTVPISNEEYCQISWKVPSENRQENATLGSTVEAYPARKVRKISCENTTINYNTEVALTIIECLNANQHGCLCRLKAVSMTDESTGCPFDDHFTINCTIPGEIDNHLFTGFQVREECWLGCNSNESCRKALNLRVTAYRSTTVGIPTTSFIENFTPTVLDEITTSKPAILFEKTSLSRPWRTTQYEETTPGASSTEMITTDSLSVEKLRADPSTPISSVATQVVTTPAASSTEMITSHLLSVGELRTDPSTPISSVATQIVTTPLNININKWLTKVIWENVYISISILLLSSILFTCVCIGCCCICYNKGKEKVKKLKEGQMTASNSVSLWNWRDTSTSTESVEQFPLAELSDESDSIPLSSVRASGHTKSDDEGDLVSGNLMTTFQEEIVYYGAANLENETEKYRQDGEKSGKETDKPRYVFRLFPSTENQYMEPTPQNKEVRENAKERFPRSKSSSFRFSRKGSKLQYNYDRRLKKKPDTLKSANSFKEPVADEIYANVRPNQEE